MKRAAEAEAQARRLRQQAEAEAAHLKAETENRIYEERQKAGDILNSNPSLLRLEELKTLRDLARKERKGDRRIY